MTSPNLDTSSAWAVIAAMGFLAGAIRLSGPWLAQFIPQSGFVRRWIELLPDHLLIALMMPVFLSPDWRIQVAAVAAFMIRAVGGSALLAMSIAVAVLATLRTM